MPVHLPFSTASLDGKQLLSYTHEQLWELWRDDHGGEDPPEGYTNENLRIWLNGRYPALQVVVQATTEASGKKKKKSRSGSKKHGLRDPKSPVPDDARMHGLFRTHRLTLTSSAAPVTLAVTTIPGATNEVGSAPAMLKSTLARYGRTRLCEVVTADAGNCSAEIARTIRDGGSCYPVCQ